MAWTLSSETSMDLLAEDRELLYKLNGFDGSLRIAIPPHSVDLKVANGKIHSVHVSQGEARLAVTIPEDFLQKSAQVIPPLLHQGIFSAQSFGGSIDGDMVRDVAPYMGALQRVFDLLRIAYGGTGAVPLPQNLDPFRDTDSAIGRYVTITVDGIDYRIFLEESGTGERALLLQHTAGADARQWRHQLADPEFQKRFRMMAYDLPYHGRSLPPTSQDWWAAPYKPTKDWMMKVVVALADKLALHRPLFMGCSVGGQLALDLSAHYGARFGGFVALNGSLDFPGVANDPWNDLCRDPRVSGELYAVGCQGVTSPFGPEAFRREVYWIYRSNMHGIYAGDNDYFYEHDLKVDGHLIDGHKTPTYLVAGEYDPIAVLPDHGGPAVAVRFPSVIYRMLPGLSHFAPSDDPLGFRDAVLPILDEILAKAGARAAA